MIRILWASSEYLIDFDMDAALGKICNKWRLDYSFQKMLAWWKLLETQFSVPQFFELLLLAAVSWVKVFKHTLWVTLKLNWISYLIILKIPWSTIKEDKNKPKFLSFSIAIFYKTLMALICPKLCVGHYCGAWRWLDLILIL